MIIGFGCQGLILKLAAAVTRRDESPPPSRTPVCARQLITAAFDDKPDASRQSAVGTTGPAFHLPAWGRGQSGAGPVGGRGRRGCCLSVRQEVDPTQTGRQTQQLTAYPISLPVASSNFLSLSRSSWRPPCRCPSCSQLPNTSLAPSRTPPVFRSGLPRRCTLPTPQRSRSSTAPVQPQYNQEDDG